MINDVSNRSGEITIGYSSGYINAEKHILKSLEKDEIAAKAIIKTISPTTGLLQNNTNLWELYFALREKKFFPVVEDDKAVNAGAGLQISLSMEEAEYFLGAIRTLKEIGFEHSIKTNFNLVNNLKTALDQVVADLFRG